MNKTLIRNLRPDVLEDDNIDYSFNISGLYFLYQTNYFNEKRNISENIFKHKIKNLIIQISDRTEYEMLTQQKFINIKFKELIKL